MSRDVTFAPWFRVYGLGRHRCPEAVVAAAAAAIPSLRDAGAHHLVFAGIPTCRYRFFPLPEETETCKRVGFGPVRTQSVLAKTKRLCARICYYLVLINFQQCGSRKVTFTHRTLQNKVAQKRYALGKQII